MATTKQQLIAAKLGEDLDAWVGGRRIGGMSWRKIAREIEARTEVEVTWETLRNWYVEVAA